MTTTAYLEPEEIQRLLSTSTSLRNTLLIRLLYELGCTLKELVNIRVRDVDLGTGCITIPKSSDSIRNSRECIFSSSTLTDLNQYLSQRGLLDKKLSYVFTSSHGGHMTVRRATQIISAQLRIAGFKERSNPQVLKYSHIINAYKQNVPVTSIQHQVGLTKQRLIAILLEIEEEPGEYRQFFE